MKGTFAIGGKPFAVRGTSVGIIRDGLIVRNSDYWDRVAFNQQVEVAGSEPH